MASAHKEARVMIDIMRFGNEIGVTQAMDEIWADDFNPEDPGSHSGAVRTLLYYGETIGTFVKSGAISSRLVHDLMWVEGLWQKCGPFALAHRTKMYNEALWENIEALVKAN